MPQHGDERIVRICIKDGPVLLRNLPESGVNASYPLWDDASASEFFPPKVETANYVLTVEKRVMLASQVRSAEKDLVEALGLIAAVWSFSGGSHLLIDTHELSSIPRFESNADEVEYPDYT
jgi:hypothetical protein